jgi:hypothetical protein
MRKRDVQEFVEHVVNDPNLRLGEILESRGPEGYYRLKTGLGASPFATAVPCKKFPDEVLAERYEHHIDTALAAQDDLADAIGAVVDAVTPQHSVNLLIGLPKKDSKPKPQFGQTIFKQASVKEAIQAYEQTADAAFNELLFWARETKDASGIISFLKILKDPKLAQRFTEILNGNPRVSSGFSTDVQSGVHRDYHIPHWLKKELTVAVDDHLEQKYTAQLQKEAVAPDISTVSAVALAAKALFRVGRVRRKNSLITEIRAISRRHPVQLQLLHASLHARPQFSELQEETVS